MFPRLMQYMLYTLLIVRTYAARTPVNVTTIALRSDSIVLIQVVYDTMINYSHTYEPDQEYKDFMTLMRNEQTDLTYLYEQRVFEKRSHMSSGYTANPPLPPISLIRYSNMLARNIRPLVARAEAELGKTRKCEAVVTPYYSFREDYSSFVRYALESAGCDSSSQDQVVDLPRAVLFAHGLYATDGRTPKAHFVGCGRRKTIVIDIEPSHIWIQIVTMKESYSTRHCSHTCTIDDGRLVSNLDQCLRSFETR